MRFTGLSLWKFKRSSRVSADFKPDHTSHHGTKQPDFLPNPRAISESSCRNGQGRSCAAINRRGLPTLKLFCEAFGQDETALRARIDQEGFLYKEYPDWQECVKSQNTLKITSLRVGVERSYGNTVLSPDYIRKHWPAAGFEVRAIVEAIIDDGQDLVVLRRC